MNLLAFMCILSLFTQVDTGNLLITNNLGGASMGSYNIDTKELTLEYACIYNIGTYQFDFGVIQDIIVSKDNYFDLINLDISNIVIYSDNSSTAIYQATHTYNYKYSSSELNYSTTKRVSKEIVNPVDFTYNFSSNIQVNFTLFTYSNESYETGYGEGYETGYLIGHDNGYEAGEASGNAVNNVISWFGNIWSALTDFLSLEIAPNVRIFEVITIPIVIGVLMFVLKALIK